MELKFISLCSGCGGMDLGIERGGFECVGQVEIMPYALKVLSKHWKNVPKHTDLLTLLRSDSLVKIYRTPTQEEKVLKAKEALSSLSVCELSTSLTRLGYSLRMFPDFFRFTEEGTLQSSCKRFPKAGMGIRGEFWTVNTSESPSDAKESLLSDVLEEDVPPKYYLSKKAIVGMIRRSERYGRGGYVFLQEMDKDKTVRLRRISLQQFKQLTIKKPNTDNSGTKETSSLKLSEQKKEEMLEEYGNKLILRKLTPKEKEKLQGLPINWTLCEES